MQVSDREMLEMALVENIQREQLNEIEKANAYQKLLLECGLSHEQLSERVGKSRSAVTNTLRLLNLPEKVRIMLASGKLTMGHARAILGVEGEKARVDMARRIVEQNLTVRDVEQLSKSNTPAKNTKKKRGTAAAGAPERDPDLEEVTGKLRYHFGTSVNIIRKPDTKGKIEISFYSNDDLNRLLDLLLG
jgi:ParB family chromosome partitioning protein